MKEANLPADGKPVVNSFLIAASQRWLCGCLRKFSSVQKNCNAFLWQLLWCKSHQHSL